MSKLAIVVDHFLPRVGGIELQVHDLALALAAHFDQIDIITPTRIQQELTLAPNIKIIRIKTPLLIGYKVAFTPHMIPKIKKLLQKNHYDMVHLHCSIVSPIVFTALIYLNRWKQPHIMTAHSLNETSGKWYRYLIKLSPSLKNVITLFCGVSNKVNDCIRKIFPEGHFNLLPNAIELARWRTELKPADQFRIVTVLRFTQKKRVHALVNIIPHVLKQIPKAMQDQIEFVIIGDGPYRKKVEQLIKHYQISKHVRLMGLKTRDEIREIFSTAKLFVLPTLKEAFGIALLEARAAGLPCIAMNYGGTSDIIKHGQNGLLASDDQELTQMIVELITNEAKRQKLASNHLTDHFDWQHSIERHLKCYQQAKDLCAKSV